LLEVLGRFDLGSGFKVLLASYYQSPVEPNLYFTSCQLFLRDAVGSRAARNPAGGVRNCLPGLLQPARLLRRSSPAGDPPPPALAQ
jgi:hypothetical protein